MKLQARLCVNDREKEGKMRVKEVGVSIKQAKGGVKT